jgi:hypothetical protein
LNLRRTDRGVPPAPQRGILNPETRQTSHHVTMIEGTQRGAMRA